jgi:hypothetical protein
LEFSNAMGEKTLETQTWGAKQLEDRRESVYCGTIEGVSTCVAKIIFCPTRYAAD